MKWFLDLFSSTLGRKLMMALTGLFLISFLAVHLAGNLQLLKHDGGKSFNVYAEFMSTNPLVQTISKGNFLLIIIHVVWSVILSKRNREARGGVSYAVTNKSSIWSSRNMGILGTIILAFIVIHLWNFYYRVHYGHDIPMVNYDGKEVTDLYSAAVLAFANPVYVVFYTFCMIAIGFHLWHGFISAFQTLGWNHMKYNPIINFVGKAFAIIVPALFALIPIWMFIGK